MMFELTWFETGLSAFLYYVGMYTPQFQLRVVRGARPRSATTTRAGALASLKQA